MFVTEMAWGKADIRQILGCFGLGGRKSAIYAVGVIVQYHLPAMMAKGFAMIVQKWHGLCEE